MEDNGRSKKPTTPDTELRELISKMKRIFNSEIQISKRLHEIEDIDKTDIEKTKENQKAIYAGIKEIPFSLSTNPR